MPEKHQCSLSVKTGGKITTSAFLDVTFRRLPRHRPLRGGTTIETVFQSLEQRKKSGCELGAETSLLSVLPKVQARDLGMNRCLGFAGKNKGSFRIRLDRRG